MSIFCKFFSTILLSAVSIFSFSAYGATWKIDKLGNGDISLEYNGEIILGDASMLTSIMIANGSSVSMIHLNSLGGSVYEAIKIGEMIKALRLDTYIQKNAKCASACFFMWINGSNRAAGYVDSKIFGLLGLHRPYLKSMKNTNASVSEQADLMRKISSYLDKKLIPRRLTDLMISRASNEIYWLTLQDLEEINQVSPDNEELYISKCDDNRRELYRQMNSAKQNGNTELYNLLNSNIVKINDCIDNLNVGIRASEVKKLMKKR